MIQKHCSDITQKGTDLRQTEGTGIENTKPEQPATQKGKGNNGERQTIVLRFHVPSQPAKGTDPRQTEAKHGDRKYKSRTAAQEGKGNNFDAMNCLVSTASSKTSDRDLDHVDVIDLPPAVPGSQHMHSYHVSTITAAVD